jgi:hypothetical protein
MEGTPNCAPPGQTIYETVGSLENYAYAGNIWLRPVPAVGEQGIAYATGTITNPTSSPVSGTQDENGPPGDALRADIAEAIVGFLTFALICASGGAIGGSVKKPIETRLVFARRIPAIHAPSSAVPTPASAADTAARGGTCKNLPSMWGNPEGRRACMQALRQHVRANVGVLG